MLQEGKEGYNQSRICHNRNYYNYKMLHQRQSQVQSIQDYGTNHFYKSGALLFDQNCVNVHVHVVTTQLMLQCGL